MLAGCGRFSFGPQPDGAVSTGGAPDAPAYAYRKTLTISSGSITAAGSLIVPVHIIDPDLRPASDGGKLVTGNDFAFVTSDGTALPFDMDYITAAGELFAWVRLPALSPGMDATFSLVFGDSLISTTNADANGTWSGYEAVWHFWNLQTDATGKHDAISSGGVVPTQVGRFGGAASFAGVCPMITIGASPALQPSSITVSAWVNPGDLGMGTDRIATIVAQDSWRAAGTGSQGYYLEIYRTITQPELAFYAADGPTYAHSFSTGYDLVNNSWFYVVGTYDETTGTSSVYVNGILRGTATMTGPIAYIDREVDIGCGPSGYWNGLIDEVRISPGAHTAAQIATEYATQLDSALIVSATEPN